MKKQRRRTAHALTIRIRDGSTLSYHIGNNALRKLTNQLNDSSRNFLTFTDLVHNTIILNSSNIVNIKLRPVVRS